MSNRPSVKQQPQSFMMPRFDLGFAPDDNSPTQFFASNTLQTVSDQHQRSNSTKTNYVQKTLILQQEIFVSENFHQKLPSGSSSRTYFRQTSVVTHLLFGRSVVRLSLVCFSVVRSSLFCLSFYLQTHEYF